MKTENLKSILLVVMSAIIFFQYKGCNSEKTEIVEIPEIKDEFEAVKPKSNPVEIVNQKTKKIDKNVSKRLEKEYNFKSEEIERMAKEIAEIEALADSLAFSEYLAIEEKNKLVELLKQCNNVNEFCQDYNDENLIANVSGVVFKNEVQKLKLDYTIKPRQIEKAVMKGLFVGGEFGSNKDLDQFTYKIDLEYLYKNKIYKTAYQRFGNEDFFLVGGSVKLF
jgi:hypothetical protein